VYRRGPIQATLILSAGAALCLLGSPCAAQEASSAAGGAPPITIEPDADAWRSEAERKNLQFGTVGALPDSEVDPPTGEFERTHRFTLWFENDALGLGQSSSDRYYTNGVRLSYQSNDVGVISRWVNGLLETLPILRAEPESWGVFVGNNIYTPEDIDEPRLLPRDRPYVGWSYLGAFLVRGSADPEDIDEDEAEQRPVIFQEYVELSLGFIGDESGSEDLQREVHDLTGSSAPEGWENQLRDEMSVQLFYQRAWLLKLGPLLKDTFRYPEVDFVPHVGFALGTVHTYFAIGGMFRVGINMGYQFGPPQLIVSAGLGTLDPPDHYYRIYVFTRVQGRIVAHNTFVEGSLLRERIRAESINGYVEGHDLSMEVFVADFEAGLVIEYDGVALSFTNVIRTREFEEQGETFLFGAVSLSVTF